MEAIEIALILVGFSGLGLLIIFLWPRRRPYSKRTAKSLNSRRIDYNREWYID